MDAERQGATRLGDDLSLSGVKSQLKEKARHPTVSITLIVFLILNLIMLVVGCMHIKDCPVKKLVPVYLIIAGCIGIVSKILPFLNRKFDLKIISYTIYALYIFEFIWMIVGSCWVYSIYKPNFDPKKPPHCDKTTYYLAFWLLTINWVFIGLTIVLTCCAAICFGIAASKK